jgi:tripeptidyl-peptidase-1
VYVARVNQEFKKSGLRGISLLAASGDQGAPGDENPSCSNMEKPMSDIFPGGSPWVLSVGATMLLNPNTGTGKINEPSVCQQETCANTPLTETSCSIPAALITSGGGFSSYDGQPSWQAPFVAKFLSSKSHPLPPKKYFNASARAFPDVSALGHGYLIMWNGQWTPVDGTSASTPVFSAMIALINSARLNANKKVIGWVNPHIYAAASADAGTFHDITTGNNLCTEYCCTTNFGFHATVGWDPVTGLGTPNFAKLMDYFVNKLP